MSNVQLTDGSPVPADRSHTEIDPKTGMQKGYIVLSPEERAKGFMKPVRRSYIHESRSVCGKMQPKNDKRIGGSRHMCGRAYPHEGECGQWKLVSQPEHARAERAHRTSCGVMTTMGLGLAETYARNPHFYSGTFCVGCHAHFPLNQFYWEDGEPMDPDLQDAWHAERAPRLAREKEERRQRRMAELRRELAELEAQA